MTQREAQRKQNDSKLNSSSECIQYHTSYIHESTVLYRGDERREAAPTTTSTRVRRRAYNLLQKSANKLFRLWNT